MATAQIEFGDEMPSVCAYCGAPADSLVAHEFHYKEADKGGMIIPIILPGLIGWITVPTSKGRERHQKVELPFCVDHQRHWRHRTIVRTLNALVLIAISIIAVIVGVKFHIPLLILTPGAAFLIGACVDAIVHWTAIRSTFVDTNNVILVGVSAEFEDQLVDLRKKRYEEGRVSSPIIGGFSFPESPASHGGEEENPFANLE